MDSGGKRPADVAIGADHGGFALKERLRLYIAEELGRTVTDCGAFSAEAVDYPDVAATVARRVAGGDSPRGILIDGAGIGSSMAANKIPGVRAAVCHDEATARSSREHNNANVLCLGANVIRVGEARRLVRIWLETPFAGGRHARRVDKIDALDRERRQEGGSR
ncbi:MAG: ribose 5-phosphate isomerase B [Candidatus Eisenbacteria bacterium]|nr:ribose 5-phosphate isomerase B [Candidatus Eisenbacteria bacterium]